MKRIRDSILDSIGRTPLVRLNRIAHGHNAEMLAKVEYLNPGGSVKDRIALKMVDEAERTGRLKPGGTIVEATAGNTGIGLALVAATRGYRCTFVLPDKMSEDKVNLLRAYGAEVVITPTSVPPDSLESYNGVADRLSKEIPGAFRPNQFANPDNPLAHYHTTGPEIWEDTEGNIDVFVAGMGTGGTISGVGRFLKERNPAITVVGADPAGSILSGDSPKGYKVEGIGEDFIPKTFNRQVVDEMIRVSDEESFNTARRLAQLEGLLVGGSSGTAVAAALKYAQRLRNRKTIVTLLPDTGRNYMTKIFSDRCMQENGFWEPEPRETITVKQALEVKQRIPALISVHPDSTLAHALGLMHEHGISQIPVINGGSSVGSVNESSLMRLVHEGVELMDQQVKSVMGKALPEVDIEADCSEAYRILLSESSAVLVCEDGIPAGVMTRIDLIDLWAKGYGR